METSVAKNSPSQDFNHPDDHFQSRYFTKTKQITWRTQKLRITNTFSRRHLCARTWNHADDVINFCSR